MEMRIGSSNKAGYLTGEVKKPPPEDPSYAIWVIENYKVKSWLIDSMDPLLMQRFILLSTAKEIWKAIAKTFYDELDETCLFELNRKSFSTTQNGGPLSIYYNELVAIFQEIDHKITSQEETVEGMVQLHSQWLGFESIFFLSGLDPEFDHVYREILRKDPKLNLESTYTYVQREYQQRQTMGDFLELAEVSESFQHNSQ
uniref:Retrotransposon gag domain-containing protein n=1 Tax=Manihot esculenta TaxID=3983 RepID=A0A2C9V491_MANES